MSVDENGKVESLEEEKSVWGCLIVVVVCMIGFFFFGFRVLEV